MIENIYDYADPKSVDKPVMFLGETCEVRHVPLGVVLIISAWNYPVQLSLCPLVGAIGGGNTAIVKMSEIASHTAVLMARLIPAYLDPECVQVVLGAIPESTTLLQQPFDLFCYTGNTQVGKIVHQAASKNLTPVLLELGGKSPCIIDATIDPAIAAKRIAWGKIMNAGQTCIAPDYVLIDKRVSKKFLAALESAFNELLQGPADKSASYARIVSDRHFERLTSMLANELKVSGSTKIYGGSSRKSDRFIEPTVVLLSDADVSKHPVLQEEIFGPILPVIEFDNVDQAIDFAKGVYFLFHLDMLLHCLCIHSRMIAEQLKRSFRKLMLAMRLQTILS
jgi:aldehyde dehydrogenase (NAD+)